MRLGWWQCRQLCNSK